MVTRDDHLPAGKTFPVTGPPDFDAEVTRHGRRAAALPAQAPLRERRLVEWMLDFASPPADPQLPDQRDEIAKRVAGWLADIHRHRTFPDRLAAFTRRVFPGWAAEAKHVVTIPLFETTHGRIRISHAVEGGRLPAMLSYALLLLLDEQRGFLADLDRCGYCHRFTLLPPSTGPGRRERGACCDEHRDILRKADQRERQARSRARRNARRKP